MWPLVRPLAETRRVAVVDLPGHGRSTITNDAYAFGFEHTVDAVAATIDGHHLRPAHVVGYSTLERSRTGLEESMNDFLTGSHSNLATNIQKARARFGGEVREGNDLVLTIDAEAQAVALEQLRGTCGSIVALEPASGRVLVMASRPSYDSNLTSQRFGEILGQRGPCTPAAPLLNRATQGLYPVSYTHLRANET